MVQKLDAVALPLPVGRGAPFAHTVQGHDGSCLERTGEEGAGGVTFVVIEEDERNPITPFEPVTNQAGHVELALQPDGHRFMEAAEAPRRVREVCFEQSLELGERFVVERYAAQLV